MCWSARRVGGRQCFWGNERVLVSVFFVKSKCVCMRMCMRLSILYQHTRSAFAVLVACVYVCVCRRFVSSSLRSHVVFVSVSHLFPFLLALIVVRSVTGLHEHVHNSLSVCCQTNIYIYVSSIPIMYVHIYDSNSHHIRFDIKPSCIHPCIQPLTQPPRSRYHAKPRSYLGHGGRGGFEVVGWLIPHRLTRGVIVVKHLRERYGMCSLYIYVCICDIYVRYVLYVYM